MSQATLLALTLVAAGGGEGWNIQEIIGMWVNLALFVGLIYFASRKFVAAKLVERRVHMEKALTEARAKQEEADRRLAEYEHKLKHLEEEVDAILNSHKAQGEADRARLRDEADKAIDRLVREVDFTVNQETLKAQRAIREAAVEATVKLAEKLVSDRITDADRRRLADEYIGEIVENGAS